MASTRDIRFPVDSVQALRRALIREVGSEPATRALQQAGHAAGDAIFQRLGEEADAVGQIPQDTFWSRLSALFRELGWGTVDHQTPHPGVGALVARDWFEGEEDGGAGAAPFTTGLLANILGRAAGGEVSVLQVPCDDGDGRCLRFLFGAPPVLDRLYAGLRDGADVEASLGALG